ncbi:MAG: flagellar protein FlgN [Thermodesulfovibrionales bacterium]
MTHLYEDLITVLQREYDLCLELIDLLKREKEVIVRLDAEELETLLRDKEMITFKIKGCDSKREKILEQMGFSNLKIKDVAQMVEGAQRLRLSELADNFTNVIQTIRDLNRINSRLIAKSLHYIKSSYNFLATFNISPKEKFSVEA